MVIHNLGQLKRAVDNLVEKHGEDIQIRIDYLEILQRSRFGIMTEDMKISHKEVLNPSTQGRVKVDRIVIE